MHHFSVVRSLRSVRLLLPILLTMILGVLTSWATWTGYTANRPAAVVSAATGAHREGTHKQNNLHLDQKYGRIPLSFEANRGQADEGARFLARGPGYNILLKPDRTVLTFPKAESDKNPDDENQRSNEESSVDIHQRRTQMLRRLEEAKEDGNQTVVTMSLEGANQNAAMIEGRDELEGKVNYFLGDDSSKWLTDIPTFAKVGYKNIYDGVDLVFYGNRQQLEYDLVVSPKVDPSVIQLKFDGVSAIKVDREGNLQLKTAQGDLKQAKPGIYQEVNGARKAINGSYVIKPGNKIGFKVSRYDREKPLIIDPILSYLSFVNGSGEGFAITADATGNAYVTGWVFDANLAPTAGVYQSGFGGDADCFVTKLDPSGTNVVFTTYLGGAGFDYGNSIAVDASKNVYIGGGTDFNFPTTAGTYQTIPSAITDGFIVKLSPTGSSLLFSTLLGGNGTEEVDTIALEAGTGNIFASGITTSTNLNTTPGAFGPTSKGGYEGYVAKFNSTASNVLY
ncbi:MAG TPA: SBBP repeat-containing protein, partial [Pyrinomonadaceae bacterium]|nr:SBBP repeat-containing protein [Pyrinomonadaceae bacterium]